MAEVPFFDHDAERALLGSMMLSADAIRAAVGVVDAADFHEPKHATIYRAIVELAETGALVDPITLASALNGSLESIGGKGALLTIQAETPASANAAAYATIVAGKAADRRAHATLGEISEDLLHGRDWTPRLDDLTAVVGSAPTSDRLMTGAAFVSAQPDEYPTVWGTGEEVLWASGQSLFVVGPPGVGKSTLITQLVAARLGLQDQVLGFDVAMTESRVLYLACDRPTQIAGLFKRLFGPDDMDALENELVVWRGPLEADLAHAPHLLTRMAETAGADTVVIDSLKDVTQELSTDEAGGGINRAIQTTLADGIEVLVAHHQKKGQGGVAPKTLDDVHGNSAFRNGAGSVLLLWGQAGDPIVELHHLKQPVAPVGPLKIQHDHRTGRTAVTAGPTDPLRLMRGVPGGITAEALASQDREGGHANKNEIQKARRRLDSLVERGIIAKRPGVGDEPDRYCPVIPDA